MPDQMNFQKIDNLYRKKILCNLFNEKVEKIVKEQPVGKPSMAIVKL